MRYVSMSSNTLGDVTNRAKLKVELKSPVGWTARSDIRRCRGVSGGVSGLKLFFGVWRNVKHFADKLSLM